jgi:hypothetical protein
MLCLFDFYLFFSCLSSNYFSLLHTSLYMEPVKYFLQERKVNILGEFLFWTENILADWKILVSSDQQF